MRILIVDTAQECLSLLIRTVNFLGYRAQIAADGDEAIQQQIDQRHDLILMSLELPDYDGYSITQAIRQLERTAPFGQPALIYGLARNLDGKVLDHCLQSGMDACGVRPRTISESIELLVSMCGDEVNRRRRMPAKGGYAAA